MVDYFFDSSAIVKRYITETGSAWIARLCDPAAGNPIYVTRIAGAEVVAALARRRRGKSISSKDAADAIAEFSREFDTEHFIVEVSAKVVEQAMKLADIHALRGYDAVHLASALETNANLLGAKLPPLILVSADLELNLAAIAEGLTVEDPNAHP